MCVPCPLLHRYATEYCVEPRLGARCGGELASASRLGGEPRVVAYQRYPIQRQPPTRARARQHDAHDTYRAHRKRPFSLFVLTILAPYRCPQFDIAKLTHRRNVLDIAKLEVLNKGHLKLAASSEEGLQRLALAVHEPLKEAYPRRYVSAYAVRPSSDPSQPIYEHRAPDADPAGPGGRPCPRTEGRRLAVPLGLPGAGLHHTGSHGNAVLYTRRGVQ